VAAVEHEARSALFLQWVPHIYNLVSLETPRVLTIFEFYNFFNKSQTPRPYLCWWCWTIGFGISIGSSGDVYFRSHLLTVTE